MTPHSTVSRRIYFLVFAGLMALLVVTIGAAFVHLGSLNIVVAMTIAATKAVLVILYFMHVRTAARLLWVFVGAGFFWLGILISLAMSDYLTRGWQW